jgi:hypothetical protein
MGVLVCKSRSNSRFRLGVPAAGTCVNPAPYLPLTLFLPSLLQCRELLSGRLEVLVANHFSLFA